jgi:hypothetical protein
MASMSILQSLHRHLNRNRGEQFRAHQGQQQLNRLRMKSTLVDLLNGHSKVRSAASDFQRLPVRVIELTSCHRVIF